MNHSLMTHLGKAAAAIQQQGHSRTVKVSEPGSQTQITAHMHTRGNAMPPHRFGRKVRPKQS